MLGLPGFEAHADIVISRKDRQNASHESQRLQFGIAQNDQTDDRGHDRRKREERNFERPMDEGILLAKGDHGQVGEEEHKKVATGGDVAEKIDRTDQRDQY